jgi:hypothetical protein
MKKLLIVGMAVTAFVIVSCKKHNDNASISTPPYQVGQIVTGDTIPASVKGTLAAGKTYYLTQTTVIPVGDTLVIQPGCTIKVLPSVSNPPSITVKGTLLSLGTEASPIWISSFGTKTSTPAFSSDPAFTNASDLWLGINGDTSCDLMVIKWTHIEFTGAGLGTSTPVSGLSAGDPSFAIFYQNANLKGQFILEDSWIYGTFDDAIRVQGGNANIMRNTFEKCGSDDGDVINVKGGTLGNIAYNLIVGGATNGIKISNVNQPVGTPETNIMAYNNTLVNCGYRQSTLTGKGGSINYEKGAEGQVWNNLLIDCKVGLRMNNGSSAPDTTNMQYGYTFNYVDEDSTADQVYPPTYLTKPQKTDVPVPSTFLPSGYTLGETYDAPSIVGKNNPNFVNYPLPNLQFNEIDYVGSFNFRLSNGSPAIGKGTTILINAHPPIIQVSPNFGSTAITPIGSDIGAYQSNGTGNQH